MGESTERKIKVTVLVTTYNHEKYIAECIESILIQKTNFDFELLIGVDDGGDKTLVICKEFERKFPDKIRVINNDVSNVLLLKGKRTGRYNFLNILKQAQGKYIARCDGDDYWSDENKLQMQYNLLESNSNAVVCHHWHRYAVSDDGVNYYEKEAPKEGQGYLNQEIASVEQILENKLRIKSRTIMFRNIIHQFPKWYFDIKYGDVALTMLLGKHGNFAFINKEMAVYRQTSEGVSSHGKESFWFTFEHYINWITLWEYANFEYNKKHQKTTLTTIYYFYSFIYTKYNSSFRVYLKTMKYSVFYSKLSITTRLKVSLRLSLIWIKSKF